MPKEIIWKTDTTKAGDVVPVLMWGRDGSHAVLGTAPVTADAQPDHAAGQWADLDRKQINDLIRGLRRARDMTYGRDE